MALFNRTRIDAGWRFKQADAVGVPEWNDGFLPVAQFPTNIHLDLIAHGKIPDPFLGLNEYQVQWVSEQKWLYHTDFVLCPPSGGEEKLVLQFDGLDTFATVTLNGTKILETENMHRTYRADISKIAHNGTNELEILFHSALLRGKELLEETRYQPAIFTKSADRSRMIVRKAQYHYGWNWGAWRDCRSPKVASLADCMQDLNS
jgi:beta-mannosidase